MERITSIIVLIFVCTTNAFIPQTYNCRFEKKHISLCSDNNDVEEMRQRLETLIDKDGDGGTDQEISQVSSPPLMSSIGREIRKAEIALMKELEYCDEATSELWNLWYSERGPEATRELESIEKLMNDRSQWREVERRLKALMKKHSIYWVEPVNRLATLYYLEGRFEESKALCRVVLEQKPWHFGAISGIVMVCASLEQVLEARHWAAHRLPPIPPEGTTNNRRSEWVKRAVDDAQNALLEEEGRLKSAFGRQQDHEGQEQQAGIDEQEDSWQ
mmetsp:Transcript_236/g.305  ORF Transcript_236/g.305 Transcript_236/m.305 type:complete len:274 (+) Transcript_236:111-932(+)